MTTVQDMVEKAIQKHDAVVFCRSHDAACDQACTAMKSAVKDFEAINLGDLGNSDEVLSMLNQRYQQSDVPYIFVDGEYCADVRMAIGAARMLNMDRGTGAA